jgi:alkylation response protein AidB-like acyl-CoA dehydrogenase
VTYNLRPEQQTVRDQVRPFALEVIAPVSEYWDRMPEPRQFPRDIFHKLGDTGFIGYSLPTEYGGQGRSTLEFVTVIEELCYQDTAFGLLCGISRLIALPILWFGTDELKRKYVRGCATGATIPAFALTEPNAGSDAASLQTTAMERGGEYVISGEKMFITHGDAAEIALVFCKIEGQPRISAILVETNQPGWQPRLLQNKMGIRASTTAAITLREVRAPKANLVGEIGKGFQYAMVTLDGARSVVAAQSLGIAQRALDESIKYAKTRLAFGAPIAKLQAIQLMIADMSTRIEAARLLTYKAALLQDEGQSFSREAAQAKLFASETANFCVDCAMQIHAGYGYIGEFSIIEKLYRDQRFLEIGEGTSEILRMVVASSLIGR